MTTTSKKKTKTSKRTTTRKTSKRKRRKKRTSGSDPLVRVGPVSDLCLHRSDPSRRAKSAGGLRDCGRTRFPRSRLRASGRQRPPDRLQGKEAPEHRHQLSRRVFLPCTPARRQVRRKSDNERIPPRRKGSRHQRSGSY